MITLIPFTGFYETYHSQAIDSCVERLPDYVGDDNPQAWAPADALATIYEGDGVDYLAAYQHYAKAYAVAFQRALAEAGGLDLGLEFESLVSPSEYNFTTDRIFCTIGEEKAEALRAAVSDKALQAALDYLFKPCEGFLPYYSTDLAALKSKPTDELDHNELEAYLLAHIAEVYTGGVADVDDVVTGLKKVFDDVSDILFDGSPNAADEAVEAALTKAGHEALDAIDEAYQKTIELPGKMGAVKDAF